MGRLRRDRQTPKSVGTSKSNQRCKIDRVESRPSLEPGSKKHEDQSDAEETTNTSVQLDASPRWYQTVSALTPSGTDVPRPVTPAKLAALLERVTSLHANAVLAFQSKSTFTSSSSELTFLHNILQSGTLSDRLSALTLLVQSSPLHNTKALDTLKIMAERAKGKGGREESLKALRCIVDWWVGGGAPNRKLRYFRDQPLTHPDADDAHLLVWYFEDWLKKYFFSVLQIFETLSTDPLPYVRMQALSLIYTLLREKPEQEHNLLRLLVNKLGDSEKSICSRASYHILQLLQVHPSMKVVVIREITTLILKPSASTTAAAPTPRSNAHVRFTDDATATKSRSKEGLSTKKNSSNHGRYYAAITFNQVVFGPGDKDVAMHVIDVYFRLFEIILGEGRLESATEATSDKAEIDTVRPKLSNKKSVGDGGFTEVEDADSKLISAILTGINRALPFAKLGVSDSSLNKHIDTLFLITHTSTFNISLQALMLIQHICASLTSQPSTSTSAASLSESMSDRYYRTLYSSLQDGRLASSSKQTMYLNLLFKSLRADNNKERVKSFVRRFIQLLVSGSAGGAEFVVGGLYLLGEVFSTIPGLRALLQGTLDVGEGEYDPRKRDPQFSQPSTSPVYELLPLLHHYHPTVSLHARQLLSFQPITSSPDLTLNTLTHFLDRFVYKNPKKAKSKGTSAMQPAASTTDGIHVKRIKGEVNSGVLPNEEKFWKQPIEDIPVEEVFFHRYFSRKNRKSSIKTTRALEDGEMQDEEMSSDEDSVADLTNIGSIPDGPPTPNRGEDDVNESDREEDAIWKAMKATMPSEAGEELLEDSDDVPSDLDASSDQDDEGESVSESEYSPRISLAEGSDNDDLVAVDDIPGGLLDYDGSDAEDGGEEWGGFGDGEKRKRGDKDEGKRKKRKALPTFASYEDYAKMIEGAPEDDI
ncbi:ribosome biogenesis protein [Phlebopus sp. FC_14]|nr:ribosome biogenesis protein [Phlebopus sp. FC_14]